jgi:uncharacterized membrane protein
MDIHRNAIIDQIFSRTSWMQVVGLIWMWKDGSSSYFQEDSYISGRKQGAGQVVGGAIEFVRNCRLISRRQ